MNFAHMTVCTIFKLASTSGEGKFDVLVPSANQRSTLKIKLKTSNIYRMVGGGVGYNVRAA